MVKEENIIYASATKYILTFLRINQDNQANELLTDKWKAKANLNKFKNILKKTNKPQHPPRPKSAYIFFCKIKRPLIQEEMRNELISRGAPLDVKIDIHEVTCRLGKSWAKFKLNPDPEIKKQIEENAAIDRERYHKEKESMNKKENESLTYLKSKYLFFCREERQKNPKITIVALASLWSNCKHDTKLAERYEAAKAAAESHKYNQKTERAEFNETVCQQPIKV